MPYCDKDQYNLNFYLSEITFTITNGHLKLQMAIYGHFSEVQRPVLRLEGKCNIDTG